MKNSYRTKLDRSLIFPLRTIGFAKYVRMQKIEKKWRVTAQQTVERYKDSSSVSRFIYRLRYPFVSKTIRPWMKTLETLIEQVEGECVILIELFEVPNTATIYGLLYLVIILCTGAGIAYAVISKDIATGISLGGYMVACLALILALVSAGEFIGLQRPDSYSWAYDVVDCEEAWEISNLEEEAWKAYNKYLIDQP
ncbi:hypothetical protein F5884DRAFT_473796 [Xylogone sp. PMI_703]|nr:hypothetical protein F5884DRAFT_473796 [Xylogone sp. PMI_703]